jgi:hypothetical protein
MVASTLLVLPIRLDNTTSCPRCLAAHIDDIERGKGHFTLAMSNPKKSNDLTSGPNGELIATGTVIARWLGLSGKSVYDLAKSGVLVRLSRDSFLVEESVRRYCDHIRAGLLSKTTERN